MLQHAHSGLRWVVLILLIMAIVNAGRKWQAGSSYGNGDQKLNLWTMTSAHIQFIIGLILYLGVSPKVVFSAAAMKEAVSRFYLVEHSVMMLIAIVLITIGYSRAKRLADDTKKFKTSFIFFAFGLLLILISIPWPFREGLGGSWF
jgi:hypothetical protein